MWGVYPGYCPPPGYGGYAAQPGYPPYAAAPGSWAYPPPSEHPGYRMLATAWVVGASTAFRAGAAWWDLWTQWTPHLMGLASQASPATSRGRQAEGELRDALLASARHSHNAVMHELHRGFQDLDRFTQFEDAHSALPTRRYKVKR